MYIKIKLPKCLTLNCLHNQACGLISTSKNQISICIPGNSPVTLTTMVPTSDNSQDTKETQY
jgi:hypothetical protein